jgi:hypothetical protein
VETVAITGQDVRMVEQVIGRMGYGRAAGERCAPRCPDRLAVGLVNWLDPVVSALLLALYGLIFGRSSARCSAAARPAGRSPGFRLAPLDAAEPVRGRRGRGGRR